MGKKIIVAGAGHGGLIAAAHLAKNGYEVTVVEKKMRKDLAYDWLDAIDPNVFDEVGLPHIKEDSFIRNGDKMFYNPALTAPILVKEEGDGSAKIERKFIYDKLIKFAKDSGVKFEFRTTIFGPVMDGLRVAGIDTSKGRLYADLVIDSCGVNSPVRSNLPVDCNIERDYNHGDVFFAWRAYFNKVKDAPAPPCAYEIYLVHMGEQGISWNVDEDDYIDVLIGKMQPFTVERREEILDEMRKHNPQLGTEIKRGGGDIVQIPIKQPIPIIVCDGYACIGDAAYMTQPMNGSGICVSLRMGKVLADVIMKDTEEKFTAESLWEFNYTYITEYGAAYASVGTLKNILLSFPADGIDFLFEKQIITSDDLSMYENKSGKNIADLLGRATRGMSRLPVLLRTVNALSKGSAAKDQYLEIPKEYDEAAVLKWAENVKNAYIPMSR